MTPALKGPSRQVRDALNVSNLIAQGGSIGCSGPSRAITRVLLIDPHFVSPIPPHTHTLPRVRLCLGPELPPYPRPRATQACRRWRGDGVTHVQFDFIDTR